MNACSEGISYTRSGPYPDNKAPQNSKGALNNEKPLKSLQATLISQILQPTGQRPSNDLRHAERTQQDGVCK